VRVVQAEGERGVAAEAADLLHGACGRVEGGEIPFGRAPEGRRPSADREAPDAAVRADDARRSGGEVAFGVVRLFDEQSARARRTLLDANHLGHLPAEVRHSDDARVLPTRPHEHPGGEDRARLDRANVGESGEGCQLLGVQR
jgi:hypothetical protein